VVTGVEDLPRWRLGKSSLNLHSYDRDKLTLEQEFCKDKFLFLTKSFSWIYKFHMKLLTTKEAAARLGVTVTRVQQLIAAGRLPAEKMGRDYFIKEGDLKFVADRKPGRPRKEQSEKASKQASKKKGGKQ
jgi:excisionase family DNA binding protein